MAQLLTILYEEGKIMKRSLVLVLVLALGLSTLAACRGQSKEATAGKESAGNESNSEAGSALAKDLKVAAIFGGAINDGNWNETQYNGLKGIEALGAEVSYLENVGDTDAAEAARTYASEGFDIVYLTTNSYQDYCTAVAEEFNETMFIQINGTEIGDNFKSVRIADEEQGFMQGVIAALLSESGNVGFVGGLEINPIILGSSGFQQGVDYANENFDLSITPKRISTGSFTDVNKAKETAFAMIEENVDVITPMANDASIGVMEAAEEKGIMAIGCGVGQEESAPTRTQVTVVKDVAVAYEVTFAAYLSGTFKEVTEVETYGANKGVVFLTDWFNNDNAELQDKVADVMKQLANGEITVSTQTQ